MVDVYARAFTDSGFKQVAMVTTGKGGAWSYDAKPGIATSYRARTGDNTSRTLLVGVRPAITMTQLDNGRVQVEVEAARSFAGRAVKVQKLDAGVWTTLAQLHLGAQSTALVPTLARADAVVDRAGDDERQPGRRGLPRRLQRAAAALVPLGLADAVDAGDLVRRRSDAHRPRLDAAGRDGAHGPRPSGGDSRSSSRSPA